MMNAHRLTNGARLVRDDDPHHHSRFEDVKTSKCHEFLSSRRPKTNSKISTQSTRERRGNTLTPFVEGVNAYEEDGGDVGEVLCARCCVVSCLDVFKLD